MSDLVVRIDSYLRDGSAVNFRPEDFLLLEARSEIEHLRRLADDQTVKERLLGKILFEIRRLQRALSLIAGGGFKYDSASELMKIACETLNASPEWAATNSGWTI